MRKLLITIGLITGAGSLFAGPIHDAIRQNRPEVVKQLLADGADPNEIENNRTPLYLSSQSGLQTISEHLINSGANVNLVAPESEFKRTPLHNASQQGYYSLAKLLIDNNADFNLRDFMQNTALHLAAQGHKKDHKDIVELLISKNADINSKGYRGQTPLHRAIHQQRISIADWLIYKGAELNIADNFGDRPLHLAKTKEAAQLLISKGAEVTLKNDKGQSVLWSETYDFPKKLDLIEYLISAGANANAKDIYGKSIVDYLEYQVSSESKLEVADILRNKYGAASVDDELRKDLEDLKQKVEQGSTGNTNPTDEWPRKLWEVDMGSNIISVGPHVKVGKDYSTQVTIFLEDGTDIGRYYWFKSDGFFYVLPTQRKPRTLVYLSNKTYIYRQQNTIVRLFENKGELHTQVFQKDRMSDSAPYGLDSHLIQFTWEENSSKLTAWDFTPPTLASTDNEGGNNGGNTAMSRLSIGTSGPDISIATDGKLGGPAELQKSNDLKNWRKLGDVPADSTELLITPRDSGNEFFRLKRVGE